MEFAAFRTIHLDGPWFLSHCCNSAVLRPRPVQRQSSKLSRQNMTTTATIGSRMCVMIMTITMPMTMPAPMPKMTAAAAAAAAAATTTTTTTTMYPGRFAWDYPMADAAAGFGGGDGDDEPVDPFGSRARRRRPARQAACVRADVSRGGPCRLRWRRRRRGHRCGPSVRRPTAAPAAVGASGEGRGGGG